jgi:hypothetical protein
MSFEIKCREINPEPPLTNTFSMDKIYKKIETKLKTKCI